MKIEEIKEIINTSKANKEYYAEFLYEIYKDKYVEIYLGDEYEQINIDQVSMSYPAIIFGKLLGAYGRCLVINSAYADQITKKISLGNLICINEYHIKMIKEIDKKGILQNSFFKGVNTSSIKNLVSDE